MIDPRIFLIFVLIGVSMGHKSKSPETGTEDYEYYDSGEDIDEKYTFFPKEEDFSEAVKVCLVYNETLAMPNNSQQLTTLLNYFHNSSTKSKFFVGYRMSENPQAFHLTNSQPIGNFLKWKNKNENKTCGAIDTNGELHAEDCTKKFPYFCERISHEDTASSTANEMNKITLLLYVSCFIIVFLI